MRNLTQQQHAAMKAQAEREIVRALQNIQRAYHLATGEIITDIQVGVTSMVNPVTLVPVVSVVSYVQTTSKVPS